MHTFQTLVKDEVAACRSRGRKCHSWHEAYGLLLEEFDEFWEEVRKRNSKRDRANALRELVQIASLCQRAAEDLGLLDTTDKRVKQQIIADLLEDR